MLDETVVSIFRHPFRVLLIAFGCWCLISVAGGALAASSQSLPFTLCNESTTWTRPSASQQARIWNDPRYADLGAKAYEWNHDFLIVPPDSASIQYHTQNEAGLWTEDILSATCDSGKHKNHDDWIEAWILLHRVKTIESDGSVYTITVEPTTKGFQSILFKRIALKAGFRFVDVNGRLLNEVKDK